MSYPNPAAQDGPAWTALKHGFRVDKASATLPQTTAAALFTIAGRVELTAILGEATVAIQNQANNTKLTANPTTGTSVDICAVLSTANKEAGTLFGITGTFADAMVGANAGATVFPARPVILNTGTLDLDCAANNTGEIKWTLWYFPLDEGATVVSA